MYIYIKRQYYWIFLNIFEYYWVFLENSKNVQTKFNLILIVKQTYNQKKIDKNKKKPDSTIIKFDNNNNWIKKKTKQKNKFIYFSIT